jgi:hypothetical protein
MTQFVHGRSRFTLACILGPVIANAATLSSAAEHPPTASGDPVWSIDLTDGEPAGTQTRGGAWTGDGWRTTDARSQLMIELPDPAAPEDAYALEIDLLGFDPVQQYHGNKHQFISLYSRADGSKADWHEPGKGWWNIRGGTNYMEDGGAGFKFLWAPAGYDSRHETRCIQDTADWDPTQVVTFRIVWDQWKISLFLNGETIVERKNFGRRGEDLAYLFLGTDNVYDGFAGVTYQAARLYRLEGQ